MGRDQLQELFSEKKRKAEHPVVDWASRVREWTEAVEQFYQTLVDDYLKAARPDLEILFSTKTVVEPYAGKYEIRELRLRVGDEDVLFSPKGINIAGAKGRIDVQGDCGDATIVWEDDGRWSVIASRVPKLRVVPLTADSLAEILRTIMRP